MRRKVAVFALIASLTASFAVLALTSPAGAADARPIGPTFGTNERPNAQGAAQVSPPQNPDLVAILAFVRREFGHPVRLTPHWRPHHSG
jgi:hypothetical protein